MSTELQSYTTHRINTPYFTTRVPEPRKIVYNDYSDFCFSPDGNYIYTPTASANTVQRVHMVTGEKKYYRGKRSWFNPVHVTSIVISPDNKYLFFASRDYCIYQFSIISGELVRIYDSCDSLFCFPAKVYFTISSDSKYLFSARSYTKKIYQHEIEAGELVHIFITKHQVSDISISPDSRYLFAGTEQFSIEGKIVIRNFPISVTNIFGDCDYSQYISKENLFTSSNGTITQSSLENGETIKIYTDINFSIGKFAISQDENYMYTVITGYSLYYTTYCYIAKWSLKNGEYLGCFMCTEKIKKLCFSPDGKDLVVSDYKNIYFYSLDNPDLFSIEKYTLSDVKFAGILNDCVRAYKHIRQKEKITPKIVTPDDKFLFSRTDNILRKWDVTDGNCVQEKIFPGLCTFIDCIQISPDGKYIYVALNYTAEILKYTVENMSLSGIIYLREKSWIYSIVFSSDGKYMYLLLSKDNYTHIRKIDTITGEILLTIDTFSYFYEDFINSIALSPDGKNIFYIHRGTDDIIQVDTETGKQIKQYTTEVFQRKVICYGGYLSISSDGKLLYFFGRRTGKLIVWELQGNKIYRPSQEYTNLLKNKENIYLWDTEGNMGILEFF